VRGWWETRRSCGGVAMCSRGLIGAELGG
jgi:hypothetical protein